MQTLALKMKAREGACLRDKNLPEKAGHFLKKNCATPPTPPPPHHTAPPISRPFSLVVCRGVAAGQQHATASSTVIQQQRAIVAVFLPHQHAIHFQCSVAAVL
jgi:hypothetical protein